MEHGKLGSAMLKPELTPDAMLYEKPSKGFEGVLVKHITEGLRDHFTRICDRKVEEALQEMRTVAVQKATEIALRFTSEVSMFGGHALRIDVKIPQIDKEKGGQDHARS